MREFFLEATTKINEATASVIAIKSTKLIPGGVVVAVAVLVLLVAVVATKVLFVDEVVVDVLVVVVEHQSVDFKSVTVAVHLSSSLA